MSARLRRVRPTGTLLAMSEASLRPTTRLQGRVIAYWLCSDLLTAVGLTALAWFVGRPLLREHWSGWNDGYEYLLLGLLTPPLAYARWRFGFLGDLLVMRYGILFVEERAVPVRRMQHVDLVRGPLERLFGLSTLVVFTAGNEGSAFRVPGLTPDHAQRMRDRILEARGDGQL